MRLNTLLCTSVLLAAGCQPAAPAAKSPAPQVAASPGGCPGGSATGQWSGTGIDSTGHWTFSLDLHQNGANLDGTFAWKNTDNGSSAHDHVAGTVQCDTRAFNVHTVKLAGKSGTVSPATYKGTFGPGFTSLTGTWDVGGGGHWTATRK